MPAQFQATYTPIAAAGTQAQIKHLSRLLATQLTAANLGKGYAEIQMQLKQVCMYGSSHFSPLCACHPCSRPCVYGSTVYTCVSQCRFSIYRSIAILVNIQYQYFVVLR